MSKKGFHRALNIEKDSPGHPSSDNNMSQSTSTTPKSSPCKSNKKPDNELVFDTKALLVMLECPSCHLVPSNPPIFMCQNGHNICGDCRDSFTVTSTTDEWGVSEATPPVLCPQCREVVTDARNFLAEGLLDKLKIKCPNEKDGCNELILIQNKKIHLALCHYRSILCNQKQEKDCFNVQMCYSNFLKHLKKVHKINGVKGTKLHVVQKGLSLLTALDIPMASESWPINYLESFGKTFLTGTEIAEGKIFWWIALFGPPEDAEKYIGKITLFNKMNDIEVSYSGPVNDLRRSAAIVLEEGTGLILNQSSFNPFTFLRMCDTGDPLKNEMRWNVVFTISERKQPYGFQYKLNENSTNQNLNTPKSSHSSSDMKSTTQSRDCDKGQIQ